MSKSAIKDSLQKDQINFLKEGKKEDSSVLRFALSFINKEEKIMKLNLVILRSSKSLNYL